jgi:DNA-binding response OmpR family regulator
MARVFVIEQDASVLRRIAWILLDAGHDVLVASDVLQAREKLQASSPDVVIFNTGLPCAEANREVAAIRELADAPVIDVHHHSLGAQHPRGAQADAYLHRPFDADDLLDLVATLTDRAHRIA